MKKAYLGIDIGSISTKGVVIDEDNNIIASSYLYTEGNPINASKRVVSELKKGVDTSEYKVVGVGTTGSARKLIGTMLLEKKKFVLNGIHTSQLNQYFINMKYLKRLK